MNATDQQPQQTGAKPTIVLVHGAYADASSWNRVIELAQRAGADIVEVEGSHVIIISQPQAVTDHILKAAHAVAGAHA